MRWRRLFFANFTCYIAKVIQFGPLVQATFHRFNREASCRDKVKSVSLNHRFMIASHSPDGIVQTVPLLCPPERKATNLRLASSRSLSPVRFERKGLQNCGHFSRFSKRGRRISLQPGLSGRESGIRKGSFGRYFAFNEMPPTVVLTGCYVLSHLEQQSQKKL
jgi:hypothetical protein